MQPRTEIQNLRAASAAGDLQTVQVILEQWLSIPSRQKRRIDYFSVALYDAVRNRHHEVISYLLSAGVPLNMDTVTLATKSRAYGILQLFLDHDWDINEPLRNMALPPPLMYAIEDKDLTQWFLSHSAKPDADCIIDLTPLSFAVLHASIDIIKLLFDNGGTIRHGQLLNHAVRRRAPDRLDIINLLLDMGSDVNHIMYRNHLPSYLYHRAFGLGTALHEAADIGAYDVVQALLEKGADPLIEDSTGKLALRRAEYYGHIHIAELLRPLSIPPLFTPTPSPPLLPSPPPPPPPPPLPSRLPLSPHALTNGY
ncbi:MAG: hypothetical protein M1840_004873 [Geoglossum simile]|nr:MAG: hypothetical protein M1840_004873 [Geoglossum simile]